MLLCRSFLTVDRFTEKYGNIANAKDYDGKPKYWGRFNQGVVTISLPDVAFSSGGDMDKFWELMEERTELCHTALKCRHEHLEGTVSDVAPILWQHGAFARLKKGEKIDKLLHHGYSTISLGYAGLYEAVKYMTHHSHTDKGKGEAFGLQIMKFLNDKCNQWKAEEDIDYSPYGTPIESTTYRFAKCLKKKFGDDIFKKLDGHDRNYITNSYHVPVFEEVNPFEKLSIESKFQDLSTGGAVSYVEAANLSNNVTAVRQLIDFIYDNILYAEINVKSDYCMNCGYDGEIKIIDEGGKLDWQCPNCGNKDHTKMSVARRTCGYIGANFWNQGRTNEIKDRYVHLDCHEA
jgi:ribonucleoside-triphosphate reductase